MSCNGGGCVRVVDTAEDGTVYLSSNRRPEEKPTAIDADEWFAFLADVKSGRYDPRADGECSACSEVHGDAPCGWYDQNGRP